MTPDFPSIKPDYTNGNETPHRVLKFPIVQQLIRDLDPNLLAGSDVACKKLDLIYHYLFEQVSIDDHHLATQFNEALYTAFYGLKSLLIAANLNMVEWCLEESKSNYDQWIIEVLTKE